MTDVSDPYGLRESTTQPVRTSSDLLRELSSQLNLPETERDLDDAAHTAGPLLDQDDLADRLRGAESPSDDLISGAFEEFRRRCEETWPTVEDFQ